MYIHIFVLSLLQVSLVFSKSVQILQLPKTTTVYPWATLIITMSINLACQVLPLEDTLVSTKGPRATANWRTQQELSTPKPMTQIQHEQTQYTRQSEGQSALLDHIHTTCHLPKSQTSSQIWMNFLVFSWHLGYIWIFLWSSFGPLSHNNCAHFHKLLDLNLLLDVRTPLQA